MLEGEAGTRDRDRDRDRQHTQSTAGVVVVLSSTVVFIPQESIKKRWRKKEKGKLEGGEKLLISAGWDRREKYIEEKKKRKERRWVPGYDFSPAPSLHLNSSGKLTILPDIPHRSVPDNTTEPIKSLHCLSFHCTTDTNAQHLDQICMSMQVCMSMFDPVVQSRTAVSHGASYIGSNNGTPVWTLVYVHKLRENELTP